MQTHNYINYRYFSVRYDPEGRSFSVYHEKYGVVLADCALTVYLRDLNHVAKTVTLSDFERVDCSHEKHLDSNCLAVSFCGGPELLPFLCIRFLLDNHNVRVSLCANPDPDYRYEFSGKAVWGKGFEDTFSVSSTRRCRGIRSAYGPASSPLNDALFNRKNDTMLLFCGADSPNLRFDWDSGCYRFTVRQRGEHLGFGITIKERVYTELYGLRYRCINKENTFPAPPVGFMTWYALMWNTGEKTLLDNARVVADQLKKYGANTVWVDWEWYHNDNGVGNERCDTFTPDPLKYPNGLEYVASEIEKLGLVPAVWIAATNDVSENAYYRDNREMLLLHKWSWCGQYFFDPTHPKFLNEFIPIVFRQLLDWGFKAIKWDALPISIDYYDQYHDRLYDSSLTSEQALRGAIQAARRIVGDDLYMMSCHGEASRDITFAADLFDGARIGADVFGWGEFLESCVGRLMKYYPLHNVVQYVDPDNVVLREEFNSMDQAVSRVSYISLLGTPVTFGDDLTALPPERMELLKRAIPALDIHPMDIHQGALEKDYTLVNLFVSLPHLEYQVADIFNLTDGELDIDVGFDELELEDGTDYLLFDYWNRRLEVARDSIHLRLKPCESRVFAVHKAVRRPQVVSTSRHVTQGACDIKALAWDEENLILSGVCETVEGDPYRLYIYLPEGFSPKDGSLEKVTGNLYVLSWDCAKGGSVKWSVSFAGKERAK